VPEGLATSYIECPDLLTVELYVECIGSPAHCCGSRRGHADTNPLRGSHNSVIYQIIEPNQTPLGVYINAQHSGPTTRSTTIGNLMKE
jgi:hypothetical protein